MKIAGFYIVMPISLLVFPYVFHATLNGAPFYFNKESGAVENITAILLAAALIITLLAFFRLWSTFNTLQFTKFAAVWLVLYSLGCIYFLGEEISWGQHFFKWSTPDGWREVNDQNETNLHNTSALFDQVPRTLLTLGIIIGGLFAPLTGRLRAPRQTVDENPRSLFLSQFMPGIRCVPAAFCVLFISLHDKLYDLFNISMPQMLQISAGEVKESLIAMFILVYIVDFCRRDFERNSRLNATSAGSVPKIVRS